MTAPDPALPVPAAVSEGERCTDPRCKQRGPHIHRGGADSYITPPAASEGTGDRAALAKVLWEFDGSYHAGPVAEPPPAYLARADAILAAGFRRPVTGEHLPDCQRFPTGWLCNSACSVVYKPVTGGLTEQALTDRLVELLIAEYGEDDATWRELGSARRIAAALAATVPEVSEPVAALVNCQRCNAAATGMESSASCTCGPLPCALTTCPATAAVPTPGQESERPPTAGLARFSKTVRDDAYYPEVAPGGETDG